MIAHQALPGEGEQGPPEDAGPASALILIIIITTLIMIMMIIVVVMIIMITNIIMIIGSHGWGRPGRAAAAIITANLHANDGPANLERTRLGVANAPCSGGH